MQRALDRLSSGTFDVLIVGGGATGCFTARDAAMRGLKVALVEARDFASATSAHNSKLAHGGRNTQVWDAVVTDEATGKTIALFRCTQMILRPKV